MADVEANQTDDRRAAVTAIDPVCGMTVTIKPESLVAEHDGRTYYFCGAKCRTKFMADPEQYLSPRQAVALPEGVPSGQLGLSSGYVAP